MTVFIAIIHQEENSAYGIEFPDVPGCFSAADKKDDIIRNAVEALTLHLDGEDIPTARDMSELTEEIDEARKDGALIMAIPFVRHTRVVKRVNVSIDAGVLDVIDHIANERSMSRSAFFAEAAVNWIEGAH